MEPSILGNVATWAIVYISPFLCFGIGVFISIELKLNGDLSAKHTALMSIPVAVLTIGNLLLAMSFVEFDRTTNHEIVQFGHVKSFGQFLVFSGTIILYGTLVPQLFNQVRAKVSSTHVQIISEIKPNVKD